MFSKESSFDALRRAGSVRQSKKKEAGAGSWHIQEGERRRENRAERIHQAVASWVKRSICAAGVAVSSEEHVPYTSGWLCQRVDANLSFDHSVAIGTAATLVSFVPPVLTRCSHLQGGVRLRVFASPQFACAPAI
jgi:hypothetical protein